VRILGIVSDTHDSGLALLRDGAPEIVLEEERLNRVKHTHRFPFQSLHCAFGERGLGLGEIEAITTPWNVARLRRTILGAILHRFPLSLNLLRQKSHPPQRDGIMVLNHRLRRNFIKHFGPVELPPIINVGHHDAHAAVFFVSPFEEATILVMDGYGDDASTSIYTGRGNRVERHWHTSFFNSLGMVYGFVTHHLGFRGFADEGKVMALAAYGEPTCVERFRDVVRLEPGGRYTVNMEYFDYDAFALLKPFKRKFLEAFGPPRLPGEQIEQRHKDLARALQTRIEETILHIVRALAEQFPSRNLCITGGVALNCVANARVVAETPFQHVWVPPIASDCGAPLGSALWHYHQTLGHPRGFLLDRVCYGKEYSAEEIKAALDSAGLRYERMRERDLIRRTASDLAAGKIVGWFEGRFEMGPRALGHRSMLADPRRREMKDLINARIKHRESFRPFAPAVLANEATRFFEFDGHDPFMTMAPRVRPGMEQLIPAAVHVDGTARIQTVERHVNPRYYDLIAAFGELTGVPVLINTSFNESEPMVARPQEAIACFLRTEMDVLVLGDFYCAGRDDAAVRSGTARLELGANVSAAHAFASMGKT
jgi:carbamoyltransferase